MKNYIDVVLRALNDFADTHSGSRDDVSIRVGVAANSMLKRSSSALEKMHFDPPSLYGHAYSVLLDYPEHQVSILAPGHGSLVFDLRKY